jgi:hypothetical protein
MQPLGPSEPPGEVYDAGAVFADATPQLTHRFLIKNTTGIPVTFRSESHSCSCTKVQIDKMALAPGEETALTMSVDVPQGFSSREVDCTIATDHSEHPEWPYYMRFRSFPRARIVPDRIDLGTYSPRTSGGSESSASDIDKPPVEAWLELFSPKGGEETGVPRVVGPSEELSIELDRSARIDDLADGVRRTRYRLRVSVNDPARSLGTFTRPFRVKTGHGEEATAMAIWKSEGPFTYTPRQVHFGMIRPGEPPKTQRLLIRSRNGERFRISSMDSGSPYLGIHEVGDQSPDRHGPRGPLILELTLSVPEDGAGPFLSGVIRIGTDSTPPSELLIPWSAFLRRAEVGTLGGGEASVRLTNQRSSR